MDAEQLEKLREWAEGLSQDKRPEMKAAAKAIVLLVDDVERIHIELWEARNALRAKEAQEQVPDPGMAAREVDHDLRSRLHPLVKRFSRAGRPRS